MIIAIITSIVLIITTILSLASLPLLYQKLQAKVPSFPILATRTSSASATCQLRSWTKVPADVPSPISYTLNPYLKPHTLHPKTLKPQVPSVFRLISHLGHGSPALSMLSRWDASKAVKRLCGGQFGVSKVYIKGLLRG